MLNTESSPAPACSINYETNSELKSHIVFIALLCKCLSWINYLVMQKSVLVKFLSIML